MRAVVALALFIAGLVYVSQSQRSSTREGYEELEPFNDAPKNCPNILVMDGPKLQLYNTRKLPVPGVNPITFENLGQYIQFSKWLKSQKVDCPLLVLQRGYNIQGDAVFRLKDGVLDPTNGLQVTTGGPKSEIPGIPSPGPDDLYPGFDSQGQDIGRVTDIDKAFSAGGAADAMQADWCGPACSRGIVASGKYKQREVTRPALPKVKQPTVEMQEQAAAGLVMEGGTSPDAMDPFWRGPPPHLSRKR